MFPEMAVTFHLSGNYFLVGGWISGSVETVWAEHRSPRDSNDWKIQIVGDGAQFFLLKFMKSNCLDYMEILILFRFEISTDKKRRQCSGFATPSESYSHVLTKMSK